MKRTYKQIEDSRNRRLWITEVIIPIVSAGAVLYANPEIKQKVDKKVRTVKFKVKSQFNDIKNRIALKKDKEA